MKTMNKFLTVLAALLVFVGCNVKAKENNMESNNNNAKKVLVAFFSFSGTTKGYAERHPLQTQEVVLQWMFLFLLDSHSDKIWFIRHSE